MKESWNRAIKALIVVTRDFQLNATKKLFLIAKSIRHSARSAKDNASLCQRNVTNWITIRKYVNLIVHIIKYWYFCINIFNFLYEFKVL